MEPVRIDLLPPEMPTWAVALMALAAAGLWLGVRVLTRRIRDLGRTIGVGPGESPNHRARRAHAGPASGRTYHE